MIWYERTKDTGVLNMEEDLNFVVRIRVPEYDCER